MRRTAQWFKMSPQDWLDGTRDLKLEVRAIYFDCLCLIYQFERSFRDDRKWVAHQLHVPVQTWVAARKTLLESGKLKETPDGLTNDRAEIELKARAEQRKTNQRVATEREAKRQRQASGNEAEPELNTSDGRAERELRESSQRETSDSANENNAGGARSVQRTEHHVHARETKNHHHQSQIKEKEEKKEVGDFESATVCAVNATKCESLISQSQTIDDDDYAHTGSTTKHPRSLSRSLLRELELKVGPERAEELRTTYLESNYARNARVIDAAFRGWLKKTHGIEISGRGSPLSLGQILATCPTDDRGQPCTKLPSSNELGARSRRVRDGQSTPLEAPTVRQSR